MSVMYRINNNKNNKKYNHATDWLLEQELLLEDNNNNINRLAITTEVIMCVVKIKIKKK
jgi:hypothetical protein